MNRRTLLLAAAAGLAAVLLGSAVLPAMGGVLGAWRLGSIAYRMLNMMGSGRFVAVQDAKDVYRLDLWWRPLPVLLIPNTAMLVKEGSSWVLVDAGSPDNWSHAYASRLVQAVQQATKGGRLKAILLTHGHFDHTGALPQLLKLFEDIPVITHSAEAPFLLGNEQYLPSSSLYQRGLMLLGIVPRSPPKLPESRLTVLRGFEGGSLRQYGINSLSWVPTPGHTPGHVSFLHHPSGTLLAGDAFFNVLPSFGWASGVEALLTRPLLWAAKSAAHTVLAPARSVVSALWGSTNLFAADTKLGNLSLDRLASSYTQVVRTGGVGQELGAFKIMRLLPGVAVRITPAIICQGPHCNMEQAQSSVCTLSKLRFKRALPMHDASSKGLPADAVAAFAASLPVCSAATY